MNTYLLKTFLVDIWLQKANSLFVNEPISEMITIKTLAKSEAVIEPICYLNRFANRNNFSGFNLTKDNFEIFLELICSLIDLNNTTVNENAILNLFTSFFDDSHSFSHVSEIYTFFKFKLSPFYFTDVQFQCYLLNQKAALSDKINTMTKKFLVDLIVKNSTTDTEIAEFLNNFDVNNKNNKTNKDIAEFLNAFGVNINNKTDIEIAECLYNFKLNINKITDSEIEMSLDNFDVNKGDDFAKECEMRLFTNCSGQNNQNSISVFEFKDAIQIYLEQIYVQQLRKRLLVLYRFDRLLYEFTPKYSFINLTTDLKNKFIDFVVNLNDSFFQISN